MNLNETIKFNNTVRKAFIESVYGLEEDIYNEDLFEGNPETFKNFVEKLWNEQATRVISLNITSEPVEEDSVLNDWTLVCNFKTDSSVSYLLSMYAPFDVDSDKCIFNVKIKDGVASYLLTINDEYSEDFSSLSDFNTKFNSEFLKAQHYFVFTNEDLSNHVNALTDFVENVLLNNLTKEKVDSLLNSEATETNAEETIEDSVDVSVNDDGFFEDIEIEKEEANKEDENGLPSAEDIEADLYG